jgi:4-hydroxy-3-polyprenylbenzoate decarboxylase
MANDLRSFLKALEEKGKVRVVKGADWDLEIGTVNELMAERQGPALIFDHIKDYPPGFRVATNLLHHKAGQKLAFGFSEEMTDLECVASWKDLWNKYKPIKPAIVKDGPIKENILTKKDIDIYKFPTPKWHTHDGGRYIGTGVVTITQDPEEGWINLGTYRVMIQDKSTLAFYASPGKHATIMREKYWAMGKPCPVAMCFGQDPLLFALSTISLPWGVSEYEMAGYIRGEGIKVILDPETNLPIPASAEIVVCGFSPPPEEDSRAEGPFGEWQGYYASGTRNEPVVHIKTLYYRNNPILFGQPPVKPPVNTWFPIPIHTATFLWNRLEKAGMMDIKGVYVHGPGNRIIAVISLKQRYLGHAKQIATLAGAFLQGGACTGRYIITVDDDIDPSNLNEVLWAVCTRCDPEKYIDIVPGYLTSPLDPMLDPDKRARKDYTTAKVFINACRPFHWKNQFPMVNVAGSELRKKVLSKYSDLFSEKG